MQEKTLDAFAKHGPWALLALLLVAFQSFEVRPAIATIKAEHNEMRKEEIAEAQRIENVMGQVLMAIERSNYLERRNCYNTARTQTDRDGCAKDREDR